MPIWFVAFSSTTHPMSSMSCLLQGSLPVVTVLLGKIQKQKTQKPIKGRTPKVEETKQKKRLKNRKTQSRNSEQAVP